MPALEENPKAINSQQIVQVFDNELQHPPQQEQPARERTQTDVLNNRLLKSLLSRMTTSDITNNLNNRSEETQSASEFDD